MFRQELLRLDRDRLEHAHDEKLRAANQHLRTLESEIRTWERSRPYEWSFEHDAADGEMVYYAELVDPPFSRFASLAGDCLHNMRAALDHVVYEIGERTRGSPLPADVAETSEFPITGPKVLTDRARERKIGALPSDAQDVVVALQPSALGKHFTRHKLWVLHDLERIDKHRRPLVASPVFTDMSVRVPAAAGMQQRSGGRFKIQVQFNLNARFEGRTEMARFPVRGIDEGFDPNLEIGLQVLLADEFPAGGHPIIDVLTELFEFVLTDVVRPLRRYL